MFNTPFLWFYHLLSTCIRAGICHLICVALEISAKKLTFWSVNDNVEYNVVAVRFEPHFVLLTV